MLFSCLPFQTFLWVIVLFFRCFEFLRSEAYDWMKHQNLSCHTSFFGNHKWDRRKRKIITRIVELPTSTLRYDTVGELPYDSYRSTDR